jgi:hypothetical protein
MGYIRVLPKVIGIRMARRKGRLTKRANTHRMALVFYH